MKGRGQRAEGKGVVLAFVAAVAVACGRGEALPPSLGEVTTLGVAGAENRAVSIAAEDSRVVAVWAATKGDSTDIYAAVSADAGQSFGAPVRVNDIAGDARVNGEQPPRVAIGRDIVVAWQSRKTGTSQVRLSRSKDNGQTFSPAVTIHDSTLTGARGWSSLVLDADGAAHIAWLDGRNARLRADASAGKPAGGNPPASKPAAGGHAHNEPMRQDIFQVTVKPDGSLEESSVATNVCFCCKTGVASGSNGAVYVAWRHIYPVNMRDMAVAVSTDAGRTFSPPTRVSEDGWQIEGCPEDGPSIDVAADGAVHIAWPTLVDKDTSRKGIFHSVSKDGGRTFSPRTRIDEGDGIKNAAHPQLTIAGNLPVVVWDESGPAGPRIRVRIGGGPPITAIEGEPVTYPSIAGTTSGLVTAWTANTSTGAEIRIRRVAVGHPR